MSKKSVPCIRCDGAGGYVHESWMRYGVFPGACFRCKGSGVEPSGSRKNSSLEKENGMCGSLRLEGTAKRVRDFPRFKVIAGQKEGNASFSGFATLEKYAWWKENGDTVSVSIVADSFTEGKAEVRIPTGRIAALGLRKDVKVRGKVIGRAKTVRMLTREARGDFEKKYHSRWPVVYVGTDLYEFTKKDLMKSEKSEQQELPL
jgi:hypothetical protein